MFLPCTQAFPPHRWTAGRFPEGLSGVGEHSQIYIPPSWQGRGVCQTELGSQQPASRGRKHPPEFTLWQAWQLGTGELLPKANRLPSLTGTVRTKPQGQRGSSQQRGAPSAEAWQGADSCSHFSWCTGCMSRAGDCDGRTEKEGKNPGHEAKLQTIFTNQFLIKKFQNRENHKVQKLS